MFGHKPLVADPLIRKIPMSDLRDLITEYNNAKKKWSPDSSTMKKLKTFHASIPYTEGYMMLCDFVQLMSIVSPPKKAVNKNHELFKKFAQELFVGDKYKQCELLTIDNVLAEPGEKTSTALKNLSKKFGIVWHALQIYFSNHAALKSNYEDRDDFMSHVRRIENDIHFMNAKPLHATKLAHGLNIFDALFHDNQATPKLRSLLLSNPQYAVELAYAIKNLCTKGISYKTICNALNEYPEIALEVAASDCNGYTEPTCVKFHGEAKADISLLRPAR